jgi:hypothetical protein
MVFSRYIKYMKEISSDDMNNYIYKFFVSCMMKKNYEMAINDITILKPNYTDYDLNVYLFLIKFITGSFSESSEFVLNINQNWYPEVVGIINENDFGFYTTLNLLINFKRHIIKEIVSNNINYYYYF